MNGIRPLRSSRLAGGGFTLIELMITVAIVAILASVALPSYSEHVRKGRRSDAESFMAEVVARQQHFLIDRRAYATSITAATSAGGLGMGIPTNVSTYYTVTMTVPDPAVPPPRPSFIVIGAPAGAQLADTCGTLSITNTGEKSASGTGRCW